MATKTKKSIDTRTAVDAEIIPTSTEIKAAPEQPTDGNPIQTAINELSKQHTEKGTLAFEFLKSLVAGKAPLAYDEQLLNNLTLTAFQLSDLFKHEMDVRWSSAIADVVNKFQPQAEQPAQKSTLQ